MALEVEPVVDVPRGLRPGAPLDSGNADRWPAAKTNESWATRLTLTTCGGGHRRVEDARAGIAVT